MSNDLLKLLEENAYPGRGIALGISEDGTSSIAIYFIMGRSTNSRNRIFSITEDGIQTEAFDPSALEDPSLIIYHPVREYKGHLIVTNGDQTDTVWEFMKDGKSFREALDTRTYEPDGPNYTPRISGIVSPEGNFSLSILKSMDGDPSCCCRYYFDYDHPQCGFGRFIHTYIGDGKPLPSFAGEPTAVCMPWDNADSCADAVWNALNEDNKVSLYVRYTNLDSGESQFAIRNKNV